MSIPSTAVLSYHRGATKYLFETPASASPAHGKHSSFVFLFSNNHIPEKVRNPKCPVGKHIYMWLNQEN